MDDAVFAALGTGLSATTFLVGFASIRLRGQRDRALSLSDGITKDLVRAGGERRVVTDPEVEQSAAAFIEAKELDPVTRGAVWFYWLVGSLMLALCVIAGKKSGLGFEPSPAKWSIDTYVALYFLILQAGIGGAGSADYVWVKRDLVRRLEGSTLGTVEKALRARQEGKMSEAIEHASTLVKRLPSWPWAHVFRGHVLAEQDRNAEALVDFDRAVTLSPTDPLCRLARAECRLRLDEPEGALADLEALGEHRPNDSSVMKLTGSTLYRLGRREEAIAMFTLAVHQSPEDQEARIGRAKALAGSDSPHDAFGSPSTDLLELVLEEGERVAARALSDAGRASLSRRDIQTAIEDFTFALEPRSADVNLLCLRAGAYFLAGKFEAGEADFIRALEVADDPKGTANVLRRRGIAYARTGRSAEAERDLSESIRTRESHAAHFSRGLLYTDAERFTEALADIDRAIALQSDDDDYLAHRADLLCWLNQFDLGLDEFRAIELNFPGNAHNYGLWFHQLLRLGRNAEALAVVDRAITACPEDGQLHVLKARANIAAKRYAQAAEDLDSAVSLGGDEVYISFVRADLYRNLDKFEEAETAIGVAAESASGMQHIALGNRSSLRRKLHKGQEALDDLTRAIAMDPTNLDFHVSRGCLLTKMGDHDKARLDFEYVLGEEPDKISALVHRADLNRVEGNLDDAKRDAEKAVSIAQTPVTLEMHARVLFRRREWSAAAAAYRDVLNAVPDDQDALWGLAAAYDNEGEFADAEAIFEQLSRSNPSSVASRGGYAVVLSQLGRSAESRMVFAALREELGEAIADWVEGSLSPDYLLKYDTVIADWQASSPMINQPPSSSSGDQRRRAEPELDIATHEPP